MDEFYWHYTNSRTYTVKSDHWVARNRLNPLEKKDVWNRVYRPSKHKIRRTYILFGKFYQAVTKNLTYQVMRCGSHFPVVESQRTHQIMLFLNAHKP